MLCAALAQLTSVLWADMQEESRLVKQQLLLKPSKEKSQFSAVADNVVSSTCRQLALDTACALVDT
jgi:hypothetical protein